MPSHDPSGADPPEWPEDDPAYRPAPLVTEEVTFAAADGRPTRAYYAAHRAAMAESTKGIVLLTDVYGWATEEARAAADRLAASCEAHVLVPDLFRGRPWQQGDKPAGEAFEAWRRAFPAPRVYADLLGAQAHLNAQCEVELVGLCGFCWGGGRALEALASGAVAAHAVAAFYPTRYDARLVAAELDVPALAIFAGKDSIPGADPAAARALEAGLGASSRLRGDFFVRVFDGQPHGFAHSPPDEGALRDGDAAFKLAEAWFDKYLHPARLAQ